MPESGGVPPDSVVDMAPTRVEFELALDGVNFTKAVAVSANDVSDSAQGSSGTSSPYRSDAVRKGRAYNYDTVRPGIRARAGSLILVVLDHSR